MTRVEEITEEICDLRSQVWNYRTDEADCIRIDELMDERDYLMETWDYIADRIRNGENVEDLFDEYDGEIPVDDMYWEMKKRNINIDCEC